MSLTVVLSGPKASLTQARNALAASGHAVQDTAHHHGLPQTVTGEDIREAQAFITVHGDDINAPAETVRSLGWVLRMHHETPGPVPPSPEQQLANRLAALEAELAELKGGMTRGR